MRATKVEERLKWNNPSRVDVVVSDVIVPFDLIEVDGLRNTRLLVKVA